MNVLDFDESYSACGEQPSQPAADVMSSKLPVSGTALTVCGGVPSCTGTVYCAFM